MLPACRAPARSCPSLALSPLARRPNHSARRRGRDVEGCPPTPSPGRFRSAKACPHSPSAVWQRWLTASENKAGGEEAEPSVFLSLSIHSGGRVPFRGPCWGRPASSTMQRSRPGTSRPCALQGSSRSSRRVLRASCAAAWPRAWLHMLSRGVGKNATVTASFRRSCPRSLFTVPLSCGCGAARERPEDHQRALPVLAGARCTAVAVLWTGASHVLVYVPSAKSSSAGAWRVPGRARKRRLCV